MRAVAFYDFGPPHVLEIVHLPRPVAGPGNVVVEIVAATVNPTDVSMRSGQQAHLMTQLKPPFICGMEFAGYIRELGSTSTRLSVGQAVFGVVNARRAEGGAYAEYVCVPEASVVPAPEDLDLNEAATIPMNGLTAYMVLQSLALPSGGTLLVTGGAGALGGYVIQLARHAGLAVIADAKEQDRELLTGLGARDVVPRGEGMSPAVRARYPAGVDALLDAALVGQSAAALVRDGGTVVSIRAQVLDEQRLKLKRVGVLEQLTNTEALNVLADRARQKILTPRVSCRIPMAEVQQAHHLIERGGLRGRVVLVP